MSYYNARAFSETVLYDELLHLEAELVDLGFWLATDSGYNISSVATIPFLAASLMSDADNFFSWLSVSCIHIECTFSEFILIWGIYWHPLLIKLSHAGLLILSVVLVHYFLIDEHDSSDASNYNNVHTIKYWCRSLCP